MAYTINNSWVQAYEKNFIHLSQQMGSRLTKAVRHVKTKAEVHNFERLGASTAVAKSTRHAATPEAEVPHSRRKVTLAPFHWAEMIDRGVDVAKMLIDPQSDYLKAGVNAMGRYKDDLIIAAMRGNATDGAGSSVALPAGQKIAHGSADLTLTKLLQAREILLASDVDEDNDTFWFAFDAKAQTSLLNTTEVTSSDYAAVKALVQGKIDTFAGFKFIRTQRLPLVSGTPDQLMCLAWAQSGTGLATNMEMVTDIGPRRDKSNSIQIYLEESCAATRVEDEKVVEVACSR